MPSMRKVLSTHRRFICSLFVVLFAGVLSFGVLHFRASLRTTTPPRFGSSTAQATQAAGLFYACYDAGEAYGAAWLATRAAVLQRQLPPLLASSALASLHETEVRRAALAARTRPAGRPKLKQSNLSSYSAEHLAMEHGGVLGAEPDTAMPFKSVDLLHFSVEHLSWVERRLGAMDGGGG
jgi:hypothetical protein